MKKFFTLFAAVLMAATVMAEESSPKARFTYEAGAEVVSSYIWRGLYNGGLSLQPSVSVGFVSLADKVQFDVNVWGNVGASDWVFRKGRPNPDENDMNPNTYFVPEVDFSVNLRVYGLALGVTPPAFRESFPYRMYRHIQTAPKRVLCFRPEGGHKWC